MQVEILTERSHAGFEDGVLEVIRRLATRMNRMIEALLTVSRIEEGALAVKRKRVWVQGLLDEVAEAHESLATASLLDLRVDRPRDASAVWADRERILQVFDNLVGNAIKFTPPGGVITIGARSAHGEAMFWVSDTGPGVAAEDIPHLFDRFWQATRNDKRGAGLGLAIAKGIIEAHRGRIWAESHLGAGSTFCFALLPANSTQSSVGSVTDGA
jgi:signal transduction histidine kinase